ncbi:MAG: hypothetical protein WCO97_06945 [bacterium]
MEKSQLLIDLEKLIERKIVARNKAMKTGADKEALIKWYDAELDLLEKLEQYYTLQHQTFSKILLRERMKSYENGKKAGIIQERTGRVFDSNQN